MSEPLEERNLRQDLKDAKSSLRWIKLALFFAIITFFAEIGTFILWILSSRYTLAVGVTCLGSLIISFYCKLMSEISAPDNWERPERRWFR